MPAAHRAHPTGRTTFILGALSNAVATAVLYPMILGKALSISGMHVDRDQNLKGEEMEEQTGTGNGRGGGRKRRAKDRLIGPIADVYAKEGIRGCFRGVEGQLVKGFIQQGVTMLLKQRYVRSSLGCGTRFWWTAIP